MKNSLKVTRWELGKVVKNKAFLFSTFVLPLLILGLAAGIPLLLGGSSGEERYKVAVVDESGGLFSALSARLSGSWELSEADRETAAQELSAGELDGYLVIGPEIYDEAAVELYQREAGDVPLKELGEALSQVVIEGRLARAGYPPEEIGRLTQGVVLLPRLTEEAPKGIADFALPFGLSMLLIIAALVSGGLLMNSVLTEKTSRTVEIMLSSLSAQELMLGKILSYGALGLLQVVIWGGVGLAAASRFVPGLFGALSLATLVPAILYFLFGYLLIATMYAVMGAGMKDVQSGSQATGWISMIPAIPVYLSWLIIEDPNAFWVRVMGYIPLLTPATMLMRTAIGSVPAWEIAVTLLLLIMFDYALVRLAARVFRVGMLMYGKSATLKELWRWVRA